MASSFFPVNNGDIIQAQSVDLLATSQAWYGGASAGSSSVYQLVFNGTTAPNFNHITSLTDGQLITFKASAASAAGAQLQINNLTALPLTKSDGTAVALNTISAGQMVTVLYNTNGGSPRFELVGGGTGAAGPTG
ncbi:unnamed protein product, partial [Phaeothamnion confervicola]